MRWKPYPEYGESVAPWLGQIPAHWDVKRLKYISSLNDETLGETTDPDFEMLYVDISSVGQVSGIREKQGLIFKDAPSRARRRVRQGDVIVSTVRTYLRAIAPIADPEKNLIVSTGFAVIRPKRSFDSRFASYALRASHFVDTVVARSVGVSYPAINASELISLSVALPPIAEQRAIAALLDRETEHIDALIAQKERQIELLQEKRAALISHAVTKGLDPSAPMKDSGVEWLGEVPKHWLVERIKWVAKMGSGHTPDKQVPEYWENCDIPWVSLNDTSYLKDHDYIHETAFCVNELGLANSSAHLLPARVVLFTRDATIGLSAITTRPMAVSQHIIAWVCGPDLLPEYLLRVVYTMTQELERLTMGSTIKTIGMPDVRELITPVPPMEEQIAIARWTADNAAYLDRLVAKVLDSMSRLREYRAALISAAVTGKIDVRGG